LDFGPASGIISSIRAASSVLFREHDLTNARRHPMAKGKPAPSSSTRPSTPGKSKTPNRKADKSATSEKKPASGGSAAFTGIAIGHAAGGVWGILSSGEPQTIAELKKSVDAPADVVVAAIGWLAREHKIDFVTNGKSVKIGLC
jgi:hypothetical protein